MKKEILIKYLNNKCSDQEFEEIARWMDEQAGEQERKKWISDHWREFEPVSTTQDEKKYRALLDRIHHEINLQNQRRTQSRTVTFSKVAKWFSRAAAILFIPLLGIVFYLFSTNDFHVQQVAGLAVDSLEVIAPIGSQTVVQLSDGTEVSLNYGSRIKYPRSFNGDSREITLSGEGYFDVAHNPDQPFIVKTGKLNIKALGTEFNVQAYSGDNTISTTLVEGKVVIEKMLPDEKIESIGAMVPGQHVIYNLNSGETTSFKGNIGKYVAWKEGTMVFDNTPITMVAKELSRKFNVDIEVAEEVKELTYTVTFMNDPLFLILDLMTETTPITYKRLPRIKLPDGSFSKQKIKIEKRKS